MDSAGAIYASVDDTIAAIASAAGGAARGLVRLSGPRAALAAASLLEAGRPDASLVGSEPLFRPAELRLPGFCSALPVEWHYWPPGRSYTGQEVVELHAIGSPPLLDALMRALCSAGARLAQPGEFTLRAFLSGRIDLTQAEAVLGVIEAGNRSQWEAAVRQLAGGLSRPLGHLRAGLLDLLADIEAGLDFADEDIRFITRDEIERRLAAAIEAAEGIGRQLETRRIGADRPRAVLVGPPNAGKSSLFNALVRRSAALVADEAGTTRDYLTAPLDCGGIVWELIDTPGLAPFGPGGERPPGRTGEASMANETVAPQSIAAESPPVEPRPLTEFGPLAELGAVVGRETLSAGAAAADLDELVAATAVRCIERADLLVICLPLDGSADESIAAAWTALWTKSGSASRRGDACCGPARGLIVGTKADLCREPALLPLCGRAGEPIEGPISGPTGESAIGSAVAPPLAVSSCTGRGLSELCERLHQIGAEMQAGQGDAVASTALRCAESIDRVQSGLAEAWAACRRGEGDELLAERVRGVLDALGRIVGAVYTEELLGNIFGRFCVGK